MDIVKYTSNPILKAEDVPFKVNSIFNPGAVKFEDKYLLICRVEMPNGRSSFVLARSDGGYKFQVDKKLLLTPENHGEFYKYVEWGIEDPRVTKIGEEYFLSYTGYSRHMPLVMLSKTKDFINFQVIGPISLPTNKDCTLFPEKINGYYWKVDRPAADNRRDMWVSKSTDLIHWGGFQFLMEPAAGTWEADKIGISTPFIKTPEGWLAFYHGVRGFGITSIYKLGVLLIDLEKPWVIKRKSAEPILSPALDYERVGDVNNVIFSNGWIPEDNGELKIYYSGADTNICLALTTVKYLLSVCK
jgi:predicted GH43/DUF377 family glycosyl hydrolase